MRTTLAAALLAASAFAADPPGLKPPAAAADYRSHSGTSHFELGANLLTIDQVKSGFSSDISKGYLVVEVAVYPSRSVDVRQADFVLRVAGSRDMLRPVSARTIAAVLQKGAQHGRDIDLYPSVGVGYETGRGYDPVTGERRGGWTTGVGVGVGTGGGPRPASTDRDRGVMEAELSDKGLPEGATTQPVAGYLYFIAPRKRTVTFDLEYRPDPDRVVLPLVNPK